MSNVVTTAGFMYPRWNAKEADRRLRDACERGGSVRTASTYRRLQRFFQHVRLGEDWALPLVAGLVGPARNWTLVLDRTNWSIGAREVNYLVLAVVTRRFRVPLLWTVLPGKGNSSTAARIALVRRYLAHFPASSIGVLLADRPIDVSVRTDRPAGEVASTIVSITG